MTRETCSSKITVMAKQEESRFRIVPIAIIVALLVAAYIVDPAARESLSL